VAILFHGFRQRLGIVFLHPFPFTLILCHGYCISCRSLIHSFGFCAFGAPCPFSLPFDLSRAVPPSSSQWLWLLAALRAPYPTWHLHWGHILNNPSALIEDFTAGRFSGTGRVPIHQHASHCAPRILLFSVPSSGFGSLIHRSSCYSSSDCLSAVLTAVLTGVGLFVRSPYGCFDRLRTVCPQSLRLF
jgi:hypothetical protein